MWLSSSIVVTSIPPLSTVFSGVTEDDATYDVFVPICGIPSFVAIWSIPGVPARPALQRRRAHLRPLLSTPPILRRIVVVGVPVEVVRVPPLRQPGVLLRCVASPGSGLVSGTESERVVGGSCGVAAAVPE